MRILHFHKYLYTGGIEAIISALANEMSKTQDVTVCTVYPSNDGDVFRRRMCDRVRVDSIGKADERPPVKEIFKIADYIRKGSFDVVNFHGYFFYYVLAVLLLHKRVSFFYTVHSDAFEENSKWDRRILWYKRFCFRKGWVKPITISKPSRVSFTRLYGCDSRLISNGIAMPRISYDHGFINKFRLTEKTKVFIHAGRISAEKNQVMLCEVFNTLVNEGEDIVLIIAGPNHRPDIMTKMERFFSDRIIYIGEHPDIPSLFSCADGMCLTSFFEGLPVVLLESMAVGCIPICTPVGGIIDLIDGSNGVLSLDVSVESYCEAVKCVIKLTDSDRSIMVDNCKDTFKQYSIEECVKQYIDYYSEVKRS